MISRGYRILRLPLGALAIALATSAVNGAPASAHSTIVQQGEDYAVTDSDHRSGAVCDMESDGHIVSAAWYDDEGFRVGYEEDTTDPGCDSVSFSGTAQTVTVCEFAVGVSECTDPHRV